MTTATRLATAPGVLRTRAWRGRVAATMWGPAAFAAVNAIAFYVVRPGVNDLWAARARASAVSHGVGLTYWFSWFGGGSTPGNYSVLTPYACAAIGTELVGALATVAVTVLVTVLVRDTANPGLAGAVAALAAAINLWSGRVPFLLSAAIGVGALLAVRHRNRPATVALTLLSVMASPVAGAFIVLGLSGTFLTTRTKAYRPVIAYAIGTVGVALVGVAAVFGTPGPEGFSTGQAIDTVLGLGCLALACTTDHLRTTIAVSLIAAIALWAIPNGLGSNFTRFVWFCLPVAVAALTRRRAVLAGLLVAPVLVVGSLTTVEDLQNAVQPLSSGSYYKDLATELDRIPDLPNYRVEVVNHGAHAGYDALLGHAMLARGWETQEDNALNKSLQQNPLDPVTYKIWLDNNAVGYVALPSASVGGPPEYTLVQQGSAKYLKLVWSSADWLLYRVADPTPIVGRPASAIAHDQKSLTVNVPCACTITLRLRYSKFLAAARHKTTAAGPDAADAVPGVHARLADDGSGWTTLTTSKPGVYVLHGSLRGLLR